MGLRLLASAGVVVGLLVAAVIAYAAYTALKAPLQLTNAAISPENCSPGPCANVSGFQIWVSNVHVENDLVHMTVKFQNSSSATHTSPEDVQLIDSSRRSSIPLSDNTPGCKTWTRYEFKRKGDTFGPVDVCFRVTNTTPPFILRWTPDEGAFCCEREIRIDLS